MKCILVSPMATELGSQVQPTPRPSNLTGQTLGVLRNGKEFSDIVMDRLASELQARYGITDVKVWDKGFAAKPAPFLHEIAASCAFVINGVGH